MKNLLGEPGGDHARRRADRPAQGQGAGLLPLHREDHIAPWKTHLLRRAALSAATVRFVLGGSGHIAGVVNPPAANKYGYWTNDDARRHARRLVRAARRRTTGSWWDDWQRWMRAQNGGDKVPARIPSKAIEDAPGSYVAQRLGKK